jgi:HemK-related putative methylase
MNALTRTLTSLGFGLRRPWLRRRLGRTVLEEIDGLPLLVLPEVFNPKVFRTGDLLARAVSRLPEAAGTALDLGTGTGLGALCAARRGYRVTAVDVNPEAVRCARLNALLHRLEDRIDVREGDLFAPVAGERFDLVLFNPPFFRGTPQSPLDRAWRSEDVLERFAAELPGHLTATGRALVLLSTDGEGEAMIAAARDRRQSIGVAARRDFGNEVMTIYDWTHPELAS